MSVGPANHGLTRSSPVGDLPGVGSGVGLEAYGGVAKFVGGDRQVQIQAFGESAHRAGEAVTVDGCASGG